MFDVFGSVAHLVKLESVCIDNNVFRVHYKATVVLLFACAVLISSSQYFGDPIKCTFQEQHDNTVNMIDNYCWMHSYVTVPKDHKFYTEHELYITPGIIRKDHNTTNVRQAHYQWIGVILFFQAIFFFIPRFIWKYNLEDGKIKSLAKDITTLFPDSDKQAVKINLVINYMRANLGQNYIYFFQFVFCEMLNLLNIFCQIFLMDKFLGYEFTQHGGWFGLKVIDYTNQAPEVRSDPFSYIFPKVVKCDFMAHGASGDPVLKQQSICVLPINVFNEKIFIFIWFWFLVVAAISVLGLIYRLITIFFPKARAYILRRKFAIVNEESFEVSGQPGQLSVITDDEALMIITDRFNVADWFMLYQVGKNMDSIVFGNLIRDFIQRLKNESYRLNPKTNSNQRLTHKESLTGVDVAAKPFL